MWVGWVGWKVVWVILLTRLIALSLFSFSFSWGFGGNYDVFQVFWVGFCVHCGAGYFWVFRYMGECIICPSQGVMHFGADSHF